MTNPIITLVGGPFDGDTVKFRPTQTDLILPEYADGPMHRYAMAADGRAHYSGEVVDLSRPVRTDDAATSDAPSVADPVLCAACGGSGDRNGNRRAADPFGTCPGCDGTGKASRRIVVYDARAGRAGLTVPVGCTVGEAAWLAVAAMRVRVSPNDRPTLALRGAGLHASDPLPDDLDYELFVIGGTV